MIEKQIGHRFHVFVASVIQARQLERAFERLEQRKVRVKLIAFFATGTVVCVHDGQDLVNIDSRPKEFIERQCQEFWRSHQSD